MEIFKLHMDIMGDYKSYIESFVNIQDADIAATVKKELSSGKLWPEPLIQFNPFFETYGSIEKLIADGTLRPELKDIFKGYSLYRHQVDAIKLGVQSKDFVVTSDTGSGKSLTYTGTILNHLLESETPRGKPRGILKQQPLCSARAYRKRGGRSTLLAKGRIHPRDKS